MLLDTKIIFVWVVKKLSLLSEKQGLVDEVDRDADLQAGGIQRVVWGGEVGRAALQFLVEVGPGDKEAGLLHLEVGIQIHDGKVAALHLLLAMEGHRRGIVDGSVILGVIVAVNTHLHVQHAGNGEGGIQVAVDGEFGQR